MLDDELGCTVLLVIPAKGHVVYLRNDGMGGKEYDFQTFRSCRLAMLDDV